ncbi:E3 ubiquitin-protein ligase BOI-like [Mangifera indica]|uniref:E3 ubiquitin-protein ligase BOI-like n=1 Tax=Mangifera indica TaxID=29780 RepID=UPI001CFB26A5|nr:E3 ubiquitin-protein ligase BOI-like [Mangifera indica]
MASLLNHSKPFSLYSTIINTTPLSNNKTDAFASLIIIPHGVSLSFCLAISSFSFFVWLFRSVYPLISVNTRNMFGGDSNNPMLPVFVGHGENRFQYNANALPQLQLFGEVGCSVGPLNYVGNERVTTVDQQLKRSREVESISRQQKRRVSLKDNLHRDESGQPGCVLNPNPISTGLKLSCEEDEHNSSVSSACENVTCAIPVLSLGGNLKAEIDRQKAELDHYIRLQEENIVKGVTELKQRHTYSFLSAIERGVARNLHEKELEIENMNNKNKELVDRIKQASMEVQSWQYRAKYNESVINMLKNNLKQAMAQGAMHSKEGCGDSEVDDAASHTNVNHIVDGSGNSSPTMKQTSCRACKVREVSILLLPCRHLCLCKDCEGFIEICPICKAMKTASVQVYMC